MARRLSEYFNSSCLIPLQLFDNRKGLDVCVTLLRTTKKMQQVLDVDVCVRRTQTDFSGAFDRVIHFRKMDHAMVFSRLERYLKLTDSW